MEQWNIVVHNKFPSYIEWRLFDKIQNMIKENYADYKKIQTKGTPRSGLALLQGIVYCGKCGHKMCVKYRQKIYYICNYFQENNHAATCQFIDAHYIEKYIVATFFQALSHIELDAYTKAINLQSETKTAIKKSHSQQLERLRYQAKLAECQFNKVDPNNRLVAAELENRWEFALKELKTAEQLFEKEQIITINNDISDIPEELKIAFMDIGNKLPHIWEQGILSLQYKKEFLRCLIDKVVMHRVTKDMLYIRIIWKGGEVTTGISQYIFRVCLA